MRVALVVCAACHAQPSLPTSDRSIAVTLDHEHLTGRMFLFVSEAASTHEPRTVAHSLSAATIEDPNDPYAPMFGMDIDDASTTIVMTGESVHGYPFRTLEELPAGDYLVQAVFDRYTRFDRADGHQIWAHLDQWEGQQPHDSPGNLYSDPVQLHVRAGQPVHTELALTHVIPPIALEPDTRFVKRLRFESALVSKFWGHEIDVGAIVTLPSNYYDEPEARFPVLYFQGHFDEQTSFVVRDERPVVDVEMRPEVAARRKRAQAMWDAWHAKDGPKIIVVTLQHPTPYYDSSYLVNSPNVGPYGDMVMTELIPKIEHTFRIIEQPWARVLYGGSIGGWTAAALQIFHPEFFGGAWSVCPDPLDFRHFYGIDLYEDDNAFVVPRQTWVKTERLFARDIDGTPRNTIRRVSQLQLALGSKGRSGELFDNFSASFGAMGSDGYPTTIWDPETGRIDHAVAATWRDHGFDLRAYLAARWPQLGSQLIGKLRFLCGDSDQYELTQGMYDLQRFFEQADPSVTFSFAPHMGHEFIYPREVMIAEMVRTIARNAPPGTDLHHVHVPK